MKITLNPNKEIVKQVQELLNTTSGQCPCVLETARNEDTLCMCKEFREQKTPGYCCCGLWVKFEGEIPPKYEY